MNSVNSQQWLVETDGNRWKFGVGVKALLRRDIAVSEN